MVNNALIWIGSLLNWLPILHVSCDSNFGSFDGKANDVRISLFSLSLGQHKHYFFSIRYENGKWSPKLHKCLDFYDVCPIDSKIVIDEKADKYSAFIVSKKEDELSVQIELLKDKISQNQNRISGSFTKLNNYRALVLAFSGVGAYLLSELIQKKHGELQLITGSVFLVLFTIFAFNTFRYVTLALTIKEFTRSSFKDLKNNSTKQQLAKCFYTDFVSKNNESQVIVSITKNVEKYFKRTTIALLLSWLAISVINFNTINISSAVPSYSTTEYLVVNEKNQVNHEQLINLLRELDEVTGDIYIISHQTSRYHKSIVSFLNVIKTEKQQIISLPLGHAPVYTSTIVLIKKEVK